MSTAASQITVGLDIGYDAVRMAAIEQSPQGPLLRRIGLQPLSQSYAPTNLLDQKDDIAGAIRKILAEHSDPDWPVIVGLRNRFATVLIPKLDASVPPQSTYDWLMWEAEQFTDEPISNYVVDFGRSDHMADGNRDVLVVAVRKDSVEAMQDIVDGAGITPAGLTVASIALINAFEVTHSLSDLKTAAIAHIEPGAIDIILMRDASLNLSVMPLGSEPGSDEKAIESFSTQFRHLLNVMGEGDVPDTVYVSSERKDLERLCKQWGEQLDCCITAGVPLEGLQIDDDITEEVKRLNQAEFMVAIGLALPTET